MHLPSFLLTSIGFSTLHVIASPTPDPLNRREWTGNCEYRDELVSCNGAYPPYEVNIVLDQFHHASLYVRSQSDQSVLCDDLGLLKDGVACAFRADGVDGRVRLYEIEGRVHVQVKDMQRYRVDDLDDVVYSY